MKGHRLFGALVLGMTLAIGSAFGQTLANANIPFDFKIGNATLAAGQYEVGQVVTAGNDTMLAIRSLDGHKNIMVKTSAAGTTKGTRENKLVFRRYGDQYFLSQVWTQGKTLELPVSHREREMARSTQAQVASISGK